MNTEVLVNNAGKSRHPVAAAALWLLKTFGMWFVMLVGAVVASKLVPIDLPPAKADGPVSIGQAFLIVNGLIAVALSAVAANARVRGWRLALMIFVAYFAIGVAMMQIETLWFNESLKLPLLAIGQLVAEGAIMAVFAGIGAALMFRQAPEAAQPVPANLGLRVGAMALIYFVLYYGAGSFIAWQSEAVRTYYENGIHIQFLPTAAFQILRGSLWALIALFIVTRMKGSLARRALIMGYMFSALTAFQLLYPTSFFPWGVRSAHLLEVGSSEFIYGIVATLVLLAGAAKKPLASISNWRLVASA